MKLDRDTGVFTAVTIFTALALGAAAYLGQFPAALMPLVLLLQMISLGCLGRLAHALEDGRVGVESRWSGLGRGTAGWHLSPALAYLLCLLLFLSAFAGATYFGIRHAAGVNSPSEVLATPAGATSPSPHLTRSPAPITYGSSPAPMAASPGVAPTPEPRADGAQR